MSEVNNIIKSGINTFKDQLTTSKSFNKFKNKATKFGETGQFNVKDFSNLGKPLMKDFKKSGKNAALKTLKGLTGMLEGRTTTIKGIKVRGSGHPKDSASGTNDKPLLDYSKIRAKAPITNDGKKTVNPAKNQVLSASYNYYSWRDSFTPIEIESVDIIKPEPLVKEGVAAAVARKIPWKNVAKGAAKVGGAVLAAKSGEDLLKGLLGTPGKPKATDWDKNPKDDIDQELNIKQGQAKDKAKNKPFDKEMKAFRKGKKNLTDEDKIKRLKDAAAKYRGKK